MADTATATDETAVLPRRALRLALRVLNLLNRQSAAQFVIMVIDGTWYVSINGGEAERLG